MAEKRPWTQEEDRLLKLIYETSKLTKWSHIARRLQEDHGVKGRNGKQCKERYITYINTNHPKQDWSYSDEQKLFQFHNQLGNKWAIIGSKLDGRSDNCVKNHFYSKLKRALKKVNQAINKSFKKQYKEIKPNVLYRIVEVVQEKFKEIPKFDKQFSSFSNKLKNDLLDFAYSDEVEEGAEQQIVNTDLVREIIDSLVLFGQDYKKKTKKTKVEQDLLTPDRYNHKTKRCNSQNEESQGSSSIMHSSDTSNFQDLSDDEINRTQNKSKASRKNSQDFSGSNGLHVYRIRTRAYSQGNSRENSQSEEMKDEKDEQKQKKELQEQLQDLNIFEQDIPPHPLLMKKQTSKYSRYSQNVIQKEQYHFFEDSEIQMRILPEMVMGGNKQSQYEQNIFN